MHLEFLVEEPSAEAFLEGLLPRVLPAGVSWRLVIFQGKRDLLIKLPKRLLGYRAWMPSDWRLVVLVDEDREDCQRLKQKLEQAAAQASLPTKSAVQLGQTFTVVNRIAVEELEAWFFGDIPSLVSQYPGVTPTLGNQARYRDPDAITGGTWEALERVLQLAGYYPAGLSKIDVARRLGPVLNVVPNRSRSFQCFVASIMALATKP